jgi:hypothetical protein
MTEPETAELVEALLACTASMTLIIDHMARSPGASAGSAVDTLRNILHDVLRPLPRAVGRREVAGAARVIAAATERIGEEIYLVPHERAGPARRPPLRPRRPCA